MEEIKTTPAKKRGRPKKIIEQIDDEEYLEGQLCPHCGKADLKDLKKHVLKNHILQKPLKTCDLCGFTTYERRKLYFHMRRRHLPIFKRKAPVIRLNYTEEQMKNAVIDVLNFDAKMADAAEKYGVPSASLRVRVKEAKSARKYFHTNYQVFKLNKLVF